MRLIGCTRRPIFEPLERRELFAGTTTPEQYNLLTLLGYNHPRAIWNYKLAGTGGIDSQSTAVGGSGKVTVGETAARYDNHLSNVVTFTGGGQTAATATTAWYNNKQGTFETLNDIEAFLENTFAPSSITINLHNTMVAPPKMVLGQTYKHTGTYTGSFFTPMGGTFDSADLSGSASVTSALLMHQTVTVKAGTFNAVKGNYTLNIVGTTMVDESGHYALAGFKIIESDTFWAVPKVGIVKQTASEELDLTFPGQQTHVAKSKITANLVSDVLP